MTTVRLVEVAGLMPYASNTTLLATDAAGDWWVYKPVRGERPLWDFAPGTLAAREVLTYELAVAMGLSIVPETRRADGPFGPGSAQRFVDEDVDVDPRPLVEAGVDERLWPFAVLDLVANNADRKLGHLLIERGTGAIWGIDQGLTFHRDDKLRTVLWGFAGRRLPDEMLEAVAAACRALEGDLGDRIAGLLTPDEAQAAMRRAQALLESRMHPPPPRDRPPIPWPPW